AFGPYARVGQLAGQRQPSADACGPTVRTAARAAQRCPASRLGAERSSAPRAQTGNMRLLRVAVAFRVVGAIGCALQPAVRSTTHGARLRDCQSGWRASHARRVDDARRRAALRGVSLRMPRAQGPEGSSDNLL